MRRIRQAIVALVALALGAHRYPREEPHEIEPVPAAEKAPD